MGPDAIFFRIVFDTVRADAPPALPGMGIAEKNDQVARSEIFHPACLGVLFFPASIRALLEFGRTPLDFRFGQGVVFIVVQGYHLSIDTNTSLGNDYLASVHHGSAHIIGFGPIRFDVYGFVLIRREGMGMREQDPWTNQAGYRGLPDRSPPKAFSDMPNSIVPMGGPRSVSPERYAR